MLLGMKAGTMAGFVDAFIFTTFIRATTYSDAIVNALYTYYARYYAYLATTTLTQPQFVTLELLLLVVSPIVVGIVVGPAAGFLFHRTHLFTRRKRRGVQAILALFAFWLGQMLYGYLVLSSAYGPDFFELWTSVSFFTAFPFAYLFVRYQGK